MGKSLHWEVIEFKRRIGRHLGQQSQVKEEESAGKRWLDHDSEGYAGRDVRGGRSNRRKFSKCRGKEVKTTLRSARAKSSGKCLEGENSCSWG